MKAFYSSLCFLILSFFFFNSYSQVGISTNTPTQALDINGKVKIADDTVSPTNGVVRYSQSNEDLEGYADGEWKSLTESSGIPTNAVFLTSRVGAPDDNSVVVMPFKDETGSTIITTTVPTGKYLLITHINVSVLFLAEVDLGLFPVYAMRFNFGTGNNEYDIRGRYFGGPVFNTSAGFSPIAVVRAGQDVTVSNFTVGLLDGIGDVVVNVSGFLVDDLDFD